MKVLKLSGWSSQFTTYFMFYDPSSGPLGIRVPYGALIGTTTNMDDQLIGEPFITIHFN